ncbi:phosphotransferase [Candidatus Poribacteria bacterium]
MTEVSDSDNNVTPIFGLTRSQLRPIIEGIVRHEPVVSFDIIIEHQVQGYCGYSAEKVIPTFSYTTQSGDAGRITVFVKRFHRTGAAEAHHYINLQNHQAPTPHMYGVLTDPDEREILFLEYLEPIGDIQACEKFMDDQDNFRQCMAATANFNAIQPSGEYAIQLPRKNIVQGLTDVAVTLERIWTHACNGELGDDLKSLCLDSRNRLQQLQTFARDLIEPVLKMDKGLIHSDIYPENTGWRRGKEELLIIDLEWIGFGPRFYDAAGWLGAPDDLQLHVNQRRGLAQYYMEQYVHWGGREAPLDQFMKESSVLWLAQTFIMLWFGLARALDGRVDWTEDREAGRRSSCEGLYKELRVLLQEATRD